MKVAGARASSAGRLAVDASLMGEPLTNEKIGAAASRTNFSVENMFERMLFVSS